MTTAARPAVFIDKDGTLVENVPYNADPARLVFMPGALAALAALAEAGYALVIVTNQSGLALGRFSAAQWQRLQAVLHDRLRSEAGVELAALLYCPHAPGPRREPRCACRKPNPGMLLSAARSQRLDLVRSWMVGDTLDDVEAGRRAGCRTVLLDSGGETEWQTSPLRTPQVLAQDWNEVLDALLPLACTVPT